jgi:hypothetical protein
MYSNILSIYCKHIFKYCCTLFRTFLPKGLVGALLDPPSAPPVGISTYLSPTIFGAPAVTVSYVPAVNSLVGIFKVEF